MDLFNLRIFFIVQTSKSSSSFDKSCIATCNAVNSDCILKGLVTQFVVCLQIHSLADDTFNSKLFIIHSPAHAFICKRTTHIQSLVFNYKIIWIVRAFWLVNKCVFIAIWSTKMTWAIWLAVSKLWEFTVTGLEILKKFKSPVGDYQRKKVAKCKNAVAR